MKRIKNIHPGEVLQEEFLIPLGISAYRLSVSTGIPQTRISEIIKGNRRISADTALRISIFFGNSAQFWMNLQSDFDLEEEQLKIKTELKQIRHYKEVTGINKVPKKYPLPEKIQKRVSLVAERKR